MQAPFQLERGTSFSQAAPDYAAARPGYPDHLFDLLSRYGQIVNGTSVLEIGPGTGQATGRLLDLGARVTAVEPSVEMAALLSGRYPNRELTIVVDKVESANLPTSSFDLIVAATSFHWVEPTVRFERSHELLVAGGRLALWWNYFGDPDIPDPLRDLLQPIFSDHAPELLADSQENSPGTGAFSYGVETAHRIAEIERSGLFRCDHHETLRWSVSYSSSQLCRLFTTFSSWLALKHDVREYCLSKLNDLIEVEYGGKIVRHYLTPVYLAVATNALAQCRREGE